MPTLTPGEIEQLRLQADVVRQNAGRVVRSARDMKAAAARLEDMVATIVERAEGRTTNGTEDTA